MLVFVLVYKDRGRTTEDGHESGPLTEDNGNCGPLTADGGPKTSKGVFVVCARGEWRERPLTADGRPEVKIDWHRNCRLNVGFHKNLSSS